MNSTAVKSHIYKSTMVSYRELMNSFYLSGKFSLDADDGLRKLN